MYRKQVRRRRAVLVGLIVGSLILLSAHFSEAESGPLHVIQRATATVLSPLEVGRERGAQAGPRPHRLVRRDVGGSRRERGLERGARRGADEARRGRDRGGGERGASRPSGPRQGRARRLRLRAGDRAGRHAHAEPRQRDGRSQRGIRGRRRGGRRGRRGRRPGGPGDPGDVEERPGAAHHRPAKRRLGRRRRAGRPAGHRLSDRRRARRADA